jgi:DNA-directed RNA polymerase specialized sigma24 family protein
MEDRLNFALDDLGNEDWKQILVRLRRYAQAKCTILPADVEPDDVACEALERLLTGSRKWNKAKCPDLLVLLEGIVDSILSKIWSLQCNRVRMKESPDFTNIDAFEKYAEETSNEVQDTPYLENRLDELRGIVEGDPELEDFFLAIECGHATRKEIAETLGWDIKKVYAVTRRLKEKVERHRKDRQAGGEQ